MIIARRLKGLVGVVGLTAVDPVRDSRGWAFGPDPDPINGWSFLAQGYERSALNWRGRVTVPVLWDCHDGTIVNNESEDIVRILDEAFEEHSPAALLLRPPHLVSEIDAVNAVVYPHLNNGVYRAGFATSQAAYDEAAHDVEIGLAYVERILDASRWLAGNTFTEADIRLFTTLVRFDPVYMTHFKCNARSVSDASTLVGFVRDVAQIPGVMETVRMDEIKRHYYLTHGALNPSRIIPVSDGPDLTSPHGRSHLGPEAVSG